jgi:hypothetical protein
VVAIVTLGAIGVVAITSIVIAVFHHTIVVLQSCHLFHDWVDGIVVVVVVVGGFWLLLLLLLLLLMCSGCEMAAAAAVVAVVVVVGNTDVDALAVPCNKIMHKFSKFNQLVDVGSNIHMCTYGALRLCAIEFIDASECGQLSIVHLSQATCQINDVFQTSHNHHITKPDVSFLLSIRYHLR